MAATKSGNSEIFWMNGVSDDEQPLVFVPGVGGEQKTQTPLSLGSGSTGRSSKRGTKLRARHSSDCKTEAAVKTGGKKQGHLQSERSGVYAKDKVSVHHSAAAATEQSISSSLGPAVPSTQEISETSKSLVCLKDLCPEDKRRIANLIEELARVSEEKEESVQRLKNEQGNFECKILKLEQQNQIIIQERESLQQQYRECQELLGLYQQYLSQQQAKLNQSIAQLSQEPAYGKVLSSEEASSRTCTSRANGSLFDGSYLSLAATRAQQPQVHRTGDGGRGAAQTLSNHASLSADCGFSPTDRTIKQHRIQKRESRESHSESQLRCERCQGNGQNSGSRLENAHHDTFNQPACERLHSGSAIGSEANETLTRPQLGHEDWEEKRHQLLLQKMQLEMERERLQARLAEQEERLNRQNQQLRQSHLDYSSSNTRSGDPQPEGPSHQDLPPSVCEVAEEHPAGQSLPQTVPDTVERDKEAVTQSRKDMATSPVKSPGGLSKPTSVSVIQRTPQARSDFSVVELLDIFSPVPAPELSRTSARRPKTLERRLGRSLLPPAGVHPQSTQQDLEESQILEDIFFIY